MMKLEGEVDGAPLGVVGLISIEFSFLVKLILIGCSIVGGLISIKFSHLVRLISI